MKRTSVSALINRRVLASMLAIAFGASIAAPACAGDGRGGRVRGPSMRQTPFAARAMRAERPAAAARAQAQMPPPVPQAIPAERPVETQPVDRSVKPGRLTPEERRALRQQIHDAGRDIYRAPPP